MKRSRVLWRAAAVVLGSVLSVSLATPALAHTPTDHWTCFLGGYDNPGRCFYHLANASTAYHYASNVPSSARTAIHAGNHTIIDDHPLSAVEDPDSFNHILWSSNCDVACLDRWTTVSSGEHITGFDLNFDPSVSWNTNTSLGHGAFSTLDLWSVAAHEWGHAVGMGHSETGLGHDCQEPSVVNTNLATMTQGACITGGHTERRTLHEDDFLGRCQIYSHAHGYACSGD